MWHLLRSQKYRDTVWGFNMNGDEGSGLIRTTGEATLTCTTLWVELNLAVSPASTQCWCVRFRSSIDTITYQQPHTQTTEKTYFNIIMNLGRGAFVFVIQSLLYHIYLYSCPRHCNYRHRVNWLSLKWTLICPIEINGFAAFSDVLLHKQKCLFNFLCML